MKSEYKTETTFTYTLSEREAFILRHMVKCFIETFPMGTSAVFPGEAQKMRDDMQIAFNKAADKL